MYPNDDDEVLIGVMGPTGSGKSSFINLVSGSNLRVGQDLESCTDEVETALPFQLEGRRVVLVDTPGFDDTSKSDADVLRLVSHYLVTSYESGKKFAGILYFHRISDFRMGGISRRNFQVFRELCGDDTLANVVIVTNMWGEVTQALGNKREHQLETDDKFFAPAIAAGAKLLRHLNTKESAESILHQIVHNTPAPFKIQEEIVDQKKNLNQTAAGGVLFSDLQAMEERHRREKEEMRLQMEATNAATKEELREEIRRREADVNRLHEDMKKLMQDFREDMAAEHARRDKEREIDRQERERERGEERAARVSERGMWVKQAELQRESHDNEIRAREKMNADRERFLEKQEETRRENEKRKEIEAQNERQQFLNRLDQQEADRRASDKLKEIERQNERQMYLDRLEKQERDRKQREAELDARRENDLRVERERVQAERDERMRQEKAAEDARAAAEYEKNRGFWDRMWN